MNFKRTVLSAVVALFLLTACGQPKDVEQAGPEPTATSAPSNAPVTAPKSTEVPAATTVPVAQEPAEPADAATVIPEEPASPEEEVAPQAAESGSADANVGEGVASYLSDSLHGAVTASGETYNKDEYVAAHKDLPFGTEVLVTNLYNGKSVTVTIIDRMPSNNPHLIDVSNVAAVELEMLESGNIDARIEWSE